PYQLRYHTVKSPEDKIVCSREDERVPSAGEFKIERPAIFAGFCTSLCALSRWAVHSFTGMLAQVD
ncbi:Hypothetical predicted protein, partial [Pelobates cultripes]